LSVIGNEVGSGRGNADPNEETEIVAILMASAKTTRGKKP